MVRIHVKKNKKNVIGAWPQAFKIPNFASWILFISFNSGISTSNLIPGGFLTQKISLGESKLKMKGLKQEMKN